MSIFNSSVVNYLKQPQFFGQQLNIQRYDVSRYPKFAELYKQQNSYFWSPNEISLQTDRLDYYNLTENEKFIYTSNLKYQILLDSVQSRGVSQAFLPFCSLPELEKNIITWSFFETIHSQSYTHIIQNVYDKPELIFDHIIDIPEIIQRAKSVTKYYDDFIDMSSGWNTSALKDLDTYHHTSNTSLYELKKALYLAIANVNVLEGIRFYTSFACSFGFAENAKMIGSSDIISLIARDEACYTPNHECLTKTGWKLIEDITIDDEVAQYNHNYCINWVKPTAVIKKRHEGMIYHFRDVGGNFEQIVTEDHRMIWSDPFTGALKESLSQNFNFNSKLIPISGLVVDGVQTLNSLEILNLYFYYCGKILSVKDSICKVKLFVRGEVNWRVLGKELTTLGISYTYIINYKNMVYDIEFDVPQDTLLKNFAWVDISGKSTVWAQNLIKMCYYLSNDLLIGSAVPKTFKFDILDSKIIHHIQKVFSISNWCNKVKNPTNNKSGFRIHTDTTTPLLKISQNSRRNIITSKFYNGMVYCLTVPSGAFLVRYNQKVSLGGNCHVRLTETIIKNWVAGEDDDFVKIIKDNKPLVYEMYDVAVAEEMAWIKYLFKDGSILGLNENILSQYIYYIANRRLKAIGMTPKYPAPQKNPLPWMDHYLLSSNISVAPQESEVISYQVGNLNRDVSTNHFSNFHL